jgi:hypothetical protein
LNTIVPVGSTAATRPTRLLGDSGLTIGQVVNARVARVDGDVVQLRFGDQTVAVTSRVPLGVGQQVSLMVEEGAAGKMLLRMVDDSFGKGGAGRSADGPGGSRGGTSSSGGASGAGGTSGLPGGRQMPIPGVGRRPDQDADGSPGGHSSGRGSGSGEPGAAPGLRFGASSRASGSVGNLPGGPGSTLDPPGLPGLTAEGDLLGTLLLERPVGNASRLAATTLADLLPGRAAEGGPLADAATELVARSAMPAYGRLAQSIGGSVALGQLLASLGQNGGQTLARAPLTPADLGKLLIEIGLHPDEMNAALVAELLAQGEGIGEATVRGLRRGLATAGGTPRDAAAAVALSRLGLPITPLSLGIARQMLAGQLDPRSAWAEVLPDLQRLARYAGSSTQAGMLAAELIADWQVPLRDGPPAVERWLRTTVDQIATPLEAKLSRSPSGPGPAGEPPASTPSQDVRARLDLVAQALATAGRGDRTSLGQTLQRIQATVQSEQLLNGATPDRAEQRFFAVTLPSVVDQRPSTLQIRVRERDGQPRKPGEPARPDIVHLKLSLPGLGDLGVNLTVGQHSVSCHFSAATPFAEALLTAGAGDLVGRLKELGYSHAAVDAAHEPAAALAPIPATAPRVSHVDLKA